MKRFFYIALSALVLWACGKTEPEKPVVPPVDPAPKAVTLNISSYSAEAEGGTFEVTVKAPFVPQVDKPDWVSVTTGSLVNYMTTVKLTVAPNPAYESRSATLTFKATGATSATFSLTQTAAEQPEPEPTEISTEPITDGATQKAKDLYTFLYNQYGKKTLSSVVADVNWNHKVADQVYAWTGKYPAMNCYDFIHIYVPKNNWIDYTDLTPVTEWTEAGGIVSLMWHFNVPLTASTKPGTDGSGVTCTPSETTFRASHVFTEGSWENKWFYEQMDKVADVILALQQKGIAAIWRPFHEAAGNATAKQQADWTKAWFWWGYDGADTYKKLWVTMFDYFASKGIKNLIWVWTTQNYNGDSSKYNQDKDWYPGTKYVDIVARDLYGQDKAANAQEFSEIQNTYPGKMVTLGECGYDVVYQRDEKGDIVKDAQGNPVIDKKISPSKVGDMWNTGAKWSWFMTWYRDSLPDATWWSNAMSSTCVLNRNDVNY